MEQLTDQELREVWYRCELARRRGDWAQSDLRYLPTLYEEVRRLRAEVKRLKAGPISESQLALFAIDEASR